jgi:hypothetical protein
VNANPLNPLFYYTSILVEDMIKKTGAKGLAISGRRPAFSLLLNTMSCGYTLASLIAESQMLTAGRLLTIDSW